MDKSDSMAKFNKDQVITACVNYINSESQKINEKFDAKSKVEYDHYVNGFNRGIHGFFNWILRVVFRMKYGSNIKTIKIEPMSFDEFKEDYCSDEMWKLRFLRMTDVKEIFYVEKILIMAENSSGEVYLTAYDAGLLFSKSLESKEGESCD